MSDQGPFGDGDPFGGLPMFRDLAKLLGQQGSMSWEAARQLAISAASGGESEPNPDPTDRIRLEQLARVAELQVAAATGLNTQGVSIVPVTRAKWAEAALDLWKPRFDALAERLMPSDGENEGDSADDAGFDMMAAITKMIGPTMLGMTAGSMIGQLARHSLGVYDLPLPRMSTTELMVVQPNVNEFREAWSIDADNLALWLCVHEMTHHAVLSIPHVADRLNQLSNDYMNAFDPASTDLESKLGDLTGAFNDPSQLAGIQEMFGDPELLLGALRTPAQDALLPRLNALCSVVVGYADRVIDNLAGSLIGEGKMIGEAVRRRRVEVQPSDRFVERLFGLELGQDTYDAGREFVDGVADLGGDDALALLWSDPDNLPTPNELATPGVWVARVGLEAELDNDIEAQLADIEIPDDLSDL